MKDVGAFVKTSSVCFPAAVRRGAVIADDLPDVEHLQQGEHAAVSTGDVHGPAARLPASVQPVRVGSHQNKTMMQKASHYSCFSFVRP